MRAHAGVLGVVLSACLASAPGPAWADETTDTAAQLFNAADAARQRGDNRAAAIGFEEAYKKAPHPAVIFNAALAWELVGEPARAADGFATALGGQGLDAKHTSVSRTRLAALERSLGTVRVQTDAGATITVAHAVGRDASLPVHLAPGTYSISVAFADGRKVARAATVRAGEVASLVVEAPPPLPPPPSNTISVPVGPRPAPSDLEPEPPRSTAQRNAGIVLLGVGAAAFGTGVYLGVTALDARTQFNDSGKTDVDAHDRSASLRTATNVVWAAAGAVALTGLVLVLTAPSNHAKVSSRLAAPIAALPF